MTPQQFIAKWRQVQLTERAAAQQHFLDLCELVDHPKPAEVDPDGSWFTFERGARKHGGGDGWADVWKKGGFAFEYKGRHKDLDAAYDQLLTYREDLENPPLLVVCDMDRIIIHTNFTATAKKVYSLFLGDLGEPDKLETLRRLFHEPDKLRPGTTSTTITQQAAAKIGDVAQSLRDRGLDPHAVAHFLDRITFCLFAEDIELLPSGLFTSLLDKSKHDPERFAKLARQLFDAMATGGDFGLDSIRHFNGNLFDNAAVLDLTASELGDIHAAAKLDWSAVDPSVFGTLFERGLDPAKRAQLGAHYTSREDIETLVEPVVMAPLRREWDDTRQTVLNLLATGRKQATDADHERAAAKPLGPLQRKKAVGEAGVLVHRFLTRLAGLKVLDPACGSGNFLYVTLQKLKDLEKAVIVFAMDNALGSFLPLVGPWQLYGIELNPYAHDLAQMTVWIGYLQWAKHNGFGIDQEPILKALDQNFLNQDAILAFDPDGNPIEPTWPKVDCIVGNPPFLGGKLLRRELGDDYLDTLFSLWDGRVPREADLCCYWFEKANGHIKTGHCSRAGLLATQGIRGGANREVLKHIKDSGDIFFAESDRPWVLDGANVHVSMIGFDAGNDPARVLNGQSVQAINPDLSSHANLTEASLIASNAGISFMGDTKGGAFDIDLPTALSMLREPNPNGLPSSDVLTPWVNGMDVTSRSRGMWIIDFAVGMDCSRASAFETPFRHVEANVKPLRDSNRRDTYRRLWWQHVEPRPALRAKLAPLSRFIATTTVSKHRIFAWLEAPTLPDHQLIVFARSDDYFFGVLHSRFHEIWARAQGTQLREVESGFRYTPTTCVETFPFPWAPGSEPAGDARVEAIAAAAKELDTLRCNWLNPPEWVREEILAFPGSMDGPWARYVHDPDLRGIGTVRYPRLVPRDAACAAQLKKRTLTNLYNQRPTWLDLAHRRLDEAVAAAYDLPADLPNDQLLAELLARNLALAT